MPLHRLAYYVFWLSAAVVVLTVVVGQGLLDIPATGWLLSDPLVIVLFVAGFLHAASGFTILCVEPIPPRDNSNH